MPITRREAVIAALNHEETGHLPYAFDFTAEASAMLQEHYGCEDLAAHIGNCIRDVPGVWWTFSDWSEERLAPAVPARVPGVIGAGSYTAMAESITSLRETTDSFLLVRFYASLFEKAWFWRGMENLLSDMLLHEEFCDALFERIVTADLMMLEMMLESDVDGVLLGCDWGSQQALLMGPPCGTNTSARATRGCSRRSAPPASNAFLHSCGQIVAVLPDVVAMGVQVLNPAQPECMDLRLLKDTFGADLTFWGGVSTQQTLPYGTSEQVRQETREVAALLGKGGGYILSPAQGVQGDVPLANIVAMIEEAQRLFEG